MNTKDFFEDYFKLNSEIEEELTECNKKRKKYDFVCDFIPETFEGRCHEAKLRNALKDKNSKKNLDIMFDDLIESLEETDRKKLESIFIEVFGDEYVMTGKDLTNLLENVIENLNCVLFNDKIVSENNAVLYRIEKLIAQRYSNLCALIYNEDIYIKETKHIKEKYINNKNITIKDPKKVAIALTAICKYRSLANIEEERINYAQKLFDNIKYYNDKLEIRLKVNKYLKKLVKTNLEKLDFNRVIKDDDITDIYPNLKDALVSYVCKNDKCEELLPLLDFWYYSDANKDRRKQVSL